MGKAMLGLVTPTGARQHQINLCQRFMQSQTYQGDVCWIIVDDAEPRTTEQITRSGWEIRTVNPSPSWQPGQNTQGRNLKAGIKALSDYKVDAIFIIEDDDYYRPCYLQEMVNRLDSCLALGETHTIYYNVRLKRWIENQNDVWSSLFQTAFKPAALKYFETLYSEKFIDYAFFRICPKVKLFRTQEKLSIGMKGQPGRAGIGAGHGYIAHMIADNDGSKLREFLGDDANLYL